MLFGLILCLNAAAQDFYDVDSVREVRLQFSEANWDELLDANKQAGQDERLIGTAIVDGARYDSVGVRYKGNSSYYNTRKTGSSKLPFNIKINFRIKDQSLPGGYGTLKLSNVFRDPSFLREVMAYEIAGGYLSAPRANYVLLYVNDELLGLYNNTESIDKKFLARNFGTGNGIQFKCDPLWSYQKPNNCGLGDKASLQYLGDEADCYRELYEIKSKKGWSKLIELTKLLNETPERIEEVLDVDAVLWMLAFNNVLVNLDSYTGRLCHNYYLYRDTFGIFHPIPWDMNLNFGGFRFLDEGRQLSVEEMQRMSPFVHYKTSNDKRPLITQLMGNSLYRKIYVAHIKSIVQDHLAEAQYLQRGQDIQRGIDAYVQQDSNKLYTYDAFVANLDTTTDAKGAKIVGIQELLAGRAEYLSNHPLLVKPGAAISAVEATVAEEQVTVTAQVSEAQRVYLCYREASFYPWQRVEMRDDGEAGDPVAEDGSYTFQTPGKVGMQYYLVAEQAKVVTLSPERTSREPHTVR